MTPWEFEERSAEMKATVESMAQGMLAMDQARQKEVRELRVIKGIMWGAAAFNVMMGSWNLVTFIEKACHH